MAFADLSPPVLAAPRETSHEVSRGPIIPQEDAPVAALAVPPLEAVRLNTFDNKETVVEEWRELCDLNGGAMEQFEWVAACAHSGQRSLDVFGLHRHGELAAVAALERRSRAGVSRLEMVGVAEHFEPMEFLARDQETLRRLCDSIAATGRPISCGRLPAESPTLAALKSAYARRGLVRISPQSAAPWIAIEDSWLVPESKLNSGRRSDLRRARKRAEELGPVTVEIVSPASDQLPALLDEAFLVEGKSWKGLEQTALACDAERGEFFRRYAAAACAQGTLRMCFLKIAGKVVAMQIAVEQSRRFWLLKVGYDASFSRCSPGMLMTRETIAYAAKQKLLSYEFLGTCEPWTDIWTDRRRECVAFTAYPWSLRGMTALAVDSVIAGVLKSKFAIREAARISKQSVRQAVKAIVGRAARRYIAGENLDDAIRVRDDFHQRGVPTTLGFWDGDGDAPRAVADRYVAALETMQGQPQHAYLSIKLPSLGYSAELLDDVATRAETLGCRLHFDALTPDSVDRTQSAIEAVQRKHPFLAIGYTLPGRWMRSAADADWAVARGLSIRVVKGQFAAAGDSERDLRTGFLDVVGRLAGRAKHVDLATHDAALASEAATILTSTGTPFDRELLFGMGRPEAVRGADGKQVVRIYIPYGAAYLPYAVSRLRKNPGVAVRLLADWVKSLFRR